MLWILIRPIHTILDGAFQQRAESRKALSRSLGVFFEDAQNFAQLELLISTRPCTLARWTTRRKNHFRTRVKIAFDFGEFALWRGSLSKRQPFHPRSIFLPEKFGWTKGWSLNFKFKPLKNVWIREPVEELFTNVLHSAKLAGQSLKQFFWQFTFR